MRKRKLGRSGLDITIVGLGSWGVGGGSWAFGWGPQDESAAVAAIRRALELGINWIDTAAIYGLGQSERLIGRVLKEIPASRQPFVFTKCALLWDERDRWAQPKRILRPDTLRKEVEASLTRLGLERIDLYQIHWPPEVDSAPIEESWGEMARLVDEGKVGAIGVSNFNLDLLERCEAVRHVDSLQPPLSLIHRGSSVQLIPWCAAHGVGVIVYSPMQAGLLTDGFSAERIRNLAEDDWRRRSMDFQAPQLERNLSLRDALRPVAKRHGANVAAVAVAWTLSWPGVTGAIVGGRSPEQVDGWIAAASLELTPADLDEIARAVEQTRAGEGPIRPPLPSESQRPR
jgi:aryl-alcohol dehydrogenase-like predicted oxidoreductase